MSMDDKLRASFEGVVDQFLKFPKHYEEDAINTLTVLGIEPSLETVLAFISGSLFGSIIANVRNLSKSDPIEFKKIEDEAKLLISRRAAELREAIRMADYR